MNTTQHATSATGNVKHRAAQAAAVERLQVLRGDIHTQLATIAKLHRQLADLADTRQRVGMPFQTPAAREAADRSARLDRVAARTPNSVPPSGPVPAPVTMPSVSAAAEILFTLRSHVQRYARALIGSYDAQSAFHPGPLTIADLRDHADWHAAMATWRTTYQAWRTQVQADRAAGVCTWPHQPAPTAPPAPAGRNPLVVDPPSSDADVDQLLAHIGRLVDHYTNKPRLYDLLRELEHLQDVALTVLDGVPAKEPAPRPTCPWCGRQSLALIHRERRDKHTGLIRVEVIRCEGTHTCTCTHETCACHRGRRHEWHRAARPPENWYTLANLQNKHQELTAMETNALDAINRIRQLHFETNLQPWAGDCPTPAEHQHQALSERYAICLDCPPLGQVCAHCADLTEDPIANWPCPTIQALELDQTDTTD